MKICINKKKLGIALIVLILFKILVFKLNEKFDLYIMIFGVNQWIINLVVDFLIIITINKLILNHNTKKILKYVINFLTATFILLLLFKNLMLNSSKRYFYFESPNKSHTLVIEEDSFLLIGRSNFYERKGLIFIKSLHQGITTDDGYAPFSCNDYKLKWLDNNSVEIIYGYGSMNAYNKKIIKFD
ncbi:Uncharacterised protein [[Clostridium] sordellii]|uniref:hypothetical protein n=1 Tax=Paraclostridium sordellii TaxID=1505 RepID=UPI0005E54E6F|nr:hypothetical protein [Paeniclostridium sordellii]CEQ05980.1 Uncharacterised protein [[Clostridium] sordellii] [Paeniclostridium sordellii]